MPYGLAAIEDIEGHGENVWPPGGIIEYLQARKAEGRLGAIYCSTPRQRRDVVG